MGWQEITRLGVHLKDSLGDLLMAGNGENNVGYFLAAYPNCYYFLEAKKLKEEAI